jgi:hypothetical protein
MIHAPSALDQFSRTASAARRFLIATDFDGTLCPIADQPNRIRVAPKMLDIASREGPGLAMRAGKCALELRPRAGWDKAPPSISCGSACPRRPRFASKTIARMNPCSGTTQTA